jgi:ankyrin repeat protein
MPHQESLQTWFDLFTHTGPYQYSASWQGHSAVVELLLTHGAAADAVDAHGRSALDHALARGHGRVVAVLQRDSGHLIALSNACRKPDEAVDAEDDAAN